MHYHTSPSFFDDPHAPLSEQQQPRKPKYQQQQVDTLFERLVSFRVTQIKLCQELGFDCARETYLKGDRNVSIVVELSREYWLFLMFEMD